MNKNVKTLQERWEEENNQIVFLEEEEKDLEENVLEQEAEAMKYFNGGNQ